MALRRLGRSLRSPAAIVAAVIGLTILLRLPFLGRLPFPDEAGLAIVASNWHDDGDNLYGTLFVDRPPLLLVFYKAADLLGGVGAARWLGLLAVAVAVAAAGWIGHTLSGRRGSGWTAVATGALLANPMLGTAAVNAELLAAPLTLLSVALLLAGTAESAPALAESVASRRGIPGTALVALAGTAGAAAVLVKQNLLDALVFGATLALVAALTGRWEWRRTRQVLALGALGALVPVVLTVAWAGLAGPGVSALWETLFAFRIDAARTIAETPSSTNDARRLMLGVLAVGSGIAALVAIGGATLWRPLRDRDPRVVAAGAMITWEVVGIIGGGSYWSHYLVGLVPGVAVVTALTATRGAAARRAVKVGLGLVLASAVSATAFDAGRAEVREAEPDRAALVGTWLRAASLPRDTGTVLYGNADVLLVAEMAPGTDQLWSLPTRTLDPRLLELNRQLNGPHPPTWVIGWYPLNTWGLDPEHRVLATLHLRYRVVATVCGAPMWLHRGQHRILPAAPTDCPESG